MSHLQKALLGFLILIPISAFAHGQDVLNTLYIHFASIIIFLTISIAIKFNRKRLLILLGLYFLALVATDFYISDWPYTDNMNKINLLVAFVPAFTYLTTFLILRTKSERRVDNNKN